MVTSSIVPLLLLAPASASTPPTLDTYKGGCYWDQAANNYYWWFDAWVYDPDDDASWVTVEVEDLAGVWYGTYDLTGGPVGSGWSYWYHGSYQRGEHEWGPQCGTETLFARFFAADDDLNTDEEWYLLWLW